MTRTLRRLARTAALATLAAAALPSPASAADCIPQATTKALASLGDMSDYFFAPGGDFEGTHRWELTGAATVRTDDPPVEAAGTRVLDLGSGSVGRSPAFCVDAEMPHLRFVARPGDDDDRLRVDAVDVRSGTRTTLATLAGERFEKSWRLTPEVALSDPLDLVAGQPRDVRLRLTALSGSWQVDAVLVDPVIKR